MIVNTDVKSISRIAPEGGYKAGQMILLAGLWFAVAMRQANKGEVVRLALSGAASLDKVTEKGAACAEFEPAYFDAEAGKITPVYNGTNPVGFFSQDAESLDPKVEVIFGVATLITDYALGVTHSASEEDPVIAELTEKIQALTDGQGELKAQLVKIMQDKGFALTDPSGVEAEKPGGKTPAKKPAAKPKAENGEA